MTDKRSEQFRYAADDPAKILKVLLPLTGPVNSAVDLGGGIGQWCAALKALGAERVMCFDHPSCKNDGLKVNPDEFCGLDLSRELPEPVTCDMAICLEAAEHLPVDMSERVVAFLTECAPLVLFSAAIPDQPGKGHINCQPPEFWRELFARRGYRRYDFVRARILGDVTLPYWYRQNLYVFATDERAASFAPGADAEFIPDDFELVAKKILKHHRASLGVKTLVQMLPDAIRRAVVRRAGAKK